MLKKVKKIAITLLLFTISSFALLTVLSLTIWKPKDISSIAYGNKTAPIKLCIASRQGAFKEATLQQLVDSLKNDSVYINLIGVGELKNTDPAPYDGMIIINTCLAWKIEKDVQKFFDANPSYKSVVLFTSSGDEKGCGDGTSVPDYIDALSSATEKAGEKEHKMIVDQILMKIRPMLKK